MDVEHFAGQHPIGYVHIAYAVVWLFMFGYAIWMAVAWQKSAPK